MAKHKIKATKPKNSFSRPLQADVKDIFKSVSKGVAHAATGKWEEIANDAVEALSAIGLTSDAGDLAFLLIRRSIARAIFDLVGESALQQLLDSKRQSVLSDRLDLSVLNEDVYIDLDFIERPGELSVIPGLKTILIEWLRESGIPEHSAQSIGGRFPAFFTYALNFEWRRNSKSYRPLIEALDTPFTRAGDREWAWSAYTRHLQRKVDEAIFDESFSLRQVYVPLNASYLAEKSRKDEKDEMSPKNHKVQYVVIELYEELVHWLQAWNQPDGIRIISGGPGSGKSSFAKMFAASVSKSGLVKVLFVPLHLIDPAKDLTDEIGRFVRDEGILVQNPLAPDSREPDLLIILDGLDELASQGKSASDAATAFVREVERTVERRNQQSTKLRVLLSGRELVVQENKSEFRRPRQILTLLPYVLAPQREDERETSDDSYIDPKGLLKVDLRQQWWKNYGALSGKGYMGLPSALEREDLVEVTAQPLLSYLVALSYTREKIDFTRDVNLNSLYADLVAAVHERGYEKNRPYVPIRHMCLVDFSRVLEEVGLAAWHGDGRTTSVKEIEDHCRTGGLGSLLDVFQDGAKAGVTKLLAAFFFRQYGERPSGDPTFVFTHKSFGEYLTAQRIVRGIQRLARELKQREGNPDGGWDERDALKHWAHLCGPSPITQYIRSFILDELKLRDRNQVSSWQAKLAQLFTYVHRHGMPMEQLNLPTFKLAQLQSRNAEEALLVAVNACAITLQSVTRIDFPSRTSFGSWFRRIQGQRLGPKSCLASQCLSYLDINNSILDIGDFYGANFRNSILVRIMAHYACFRRGDFVGADLSGAFLSGSDFDGAVMHGASFVGASLSEVQFNRAGLQDADFTNAMFDEIGLIGTNLQNAKLPPDFLQKSGYSKQQRTRSIQSNEKATTKPA